MLTNSTSQTVPKSQVLLVSPDPCFALVLERLLESLGMRMATVRNEESTLAVLRSLELPEILLLDVRLPQVADGRMLAAIEQHGARRRSAVALISEESSSEGAGEAKNEWIARLREGLIDDIVPRTADAAVWQTHLSTMKRGHELYCELEDLRESSMLAMQHDPVTGALTRETMLSMLFRETDRVQRLQGSLCLMAFNIDDFGHWLSRLGLEGSHQLLREVAMRTGRSLRSYDLLGRLDVDEFLLALPGCSAVSAAAMAERLKLDAFGEAFVVRDAAGAMARARLTACFGIASSRGRSPIVVLREVEQTLAQAKLSGPDSIHCTGELAAAGESWGDLPRLFTDTEMSIG